MAQISSIEPNVDKIEHEGRVFYLVGTAHVSRSSVELAESVIHRYKPDTVAIELDEQRYSSLLNPERWRETDIFRVIREGKSYLLMAQLALAGFQKKLGNKLDVKPGEEMIAAANAAEEVGASIALIDRNVRITLKRAWSSAGLWSMTKIFFSMIGALFTSEELAEEDIEKLKSTDALELMVEQFSDYLPGVKVALVDERDAYLAEKMRLAPGQTVVAVVGAAHTPGIKRIFGTSIDLEKLDELPPPKRSIQVLSWTLPVIILGMITYGFINAGFETSAQMMKAWILWNGALAAIGAAAALAHPLTIITAFVAAPITSLNPMIAAGWVCGLVEALLRKPRIKDLETIADDISTVRGAWSNRVSKILLVIILSNLGSSIGTIVGFGTIASLL
ncbi:MAG: TraB/GumN family protein [Bdellovibrionales bacterium]|nr:TraB/GumN family protein [Bdellovibrionales bacterium]